MPGHGFSSHSVNERTEESNTVLSKYPQSVRFGFCSSQNGQYLGLIFGGFLGAKLLKTTVFEMNLQCDIYSGYHMPSIFALQ